MDYKHGDKFIVPVLVTETIGSMLVMLAVNLAGDDTLVVPLTYFAMIVSSYELSGGLLNASVTLGVYVSTKRYVNNLLFMIFIIVMQTVGCLFALGLGYLLRVQMTDEASGNKYLEPNVYATPPPLLIAVDGTPSYGQIMLSETIAAFILVITSLTARGFI